MRYVALLRAINVGGHTVKMDQLRAIFESAGFANVTTFIASGNVIFDAGAAPATLEKKLQKILAEALGYAVGVFIRTPAEIAKVAARKDVPGSVYVGFLQAAPLAAARKKLVALETEHDSFELKGREFYWVATAGMGQSKITGAQLERALGMPSTMRNITSVRKLNDVLRRESPSRNAGH